MPLGIITLEDVLEGSRLLVGIIQHPLTICFPIELIGEEIYDEFDPEGAYEDRYPYESPTDNAPDRGGDPQALHHLRPQSDVSSSSERNNQAKSLATALAGYNPSSLKGLGYFRTRSAPPVPRETETHKYEDDKVTDRDDEKDVTHLFYKTDPGHTFSGRGTAALQMPKPIKGTGRYPPSVILEQHSTISSYDSAFALREAVPAVNAEEKGLTFPPATYQNLPSLVVTAPAPARLTPPLNPHLSAIQTAPPTLTTSTQPALEAILLERRRRITSNSSNSSAAVLPSPVPSAGSFGLIHKDLGVSGGTGTPSTSNTVPSIVLAPRGIYSSSGKGFKSSPLGAGDRAGVLVAERAKAAKKSEDVQSSGQERWGNNEMGKDGFEKD